MKYTNENKPLVCFLSEGACYKGTRPMDVWGVLWHSTGANNPTIKRYVQPADYDPKKDELLQIIGVNKNGNDYNHGNTKRQMGVNAWIGKLADGTVATVQTMPWNYAPWGCGGGCNNHWIQFEICEDDLLNPEYAMAVYEEACQITAYLCKMFGIDPKATVKYNGITVPTILDHRMSHALGLGNNHGDVQHWFPKIIGKGLEDIRADVARIMSESGEEIQFVKHEEPTVPLGSRILRRGLTGNDVEEMQGLLVKAGYDIAVDGNFGPKTEEAVAAFQKDAGLSVDGIFGPQSLAALTILCNKLSEPLKYYLIISGTKEELEALQTSVGGSLVEAGKVKIS